MGKPIISIVIVAYKSFQDLKRCLPSIHFSKSEHTPFEIIIVDNYGLDGIGSWLSEYNPTIRYIFNETNTGYSGGNNIGIGQAAGQWTLLLNPDTELLPGCLDQLLITAQANPTALINPKLINPDGTINACGNQMHFTGITTCRGLNSPSEWYQELEQIPLLSGAAILSPTYILKQLGGFDEQYFMYFEDTDLSLRARLLGYELLCDSQATVVHYYKLGMTASKFYYLERNRLFTLLKVFSGRTLRKTAAALLLTEILTWGYSLRGWSYFGTRFKSYYWIWKNRRRLNASRQVVQKTRLVSDKTLLNDSATNLPFSQLTSGPLSKLMDTMATFIYSKLRPRL